MGVNLLITGGAGFIGSNLVEKFLSDDRVDLVRVVDDLSTGYYENIAEFGRTRSLNSSRAISATTMSARKPCAASTR